MAEGNVEVTYKPSFSDEKQFDSIHAPVTGIPIQEGQVASGMPVEGVPEGEAF